MVDAASSISASGSTYVCRPRRTTLSIAEALLETMERRAAEESAPGATVRVGITSVDERSRGYVETAGYELFRDSFRMQIDFDGDPPEPEWPEGISVRTLVRGQDDHAVRAAHQDAFADGFEHATWPDELWRDWAFS